MKYATVITVLTITLSCLVDPNTAPQMAGIFSGALAVVGLLTYFSA